MKNNKTRKPKGFFDPECALYLAIFFLLLQGYRYTGWKVLIFLALIPGILAVIKVAVDD
jgi:hypothetical protein